MASIGYGAHLRPNRMSLVFDSKTLVAIFRHVDARDLLLNCSLVNRHYYDVITSSIHLQLKIEKFAATLSICPSGTNTSAWKQLEALREMQDGWRQFRITKKGAMPVHPSTSSFRLSGGLFAQALVKPGSSNIHSVTFTHLPSRIARKALSWTVNTCDQAVSDLLVDASLDLLVLTGDNFAYNPIEPKLNIYFRSISTGDFHPCCALSIISTALPTSWNAGAITAKLFGFLLGVMLTQTAGQTVVMVFNIRTGTRCLLVHEANVTGFSFLNSSSIVTFQHRHQEAFMHLYTFHTDSHGIAHKGEIALAFNFPELNDNVKYTDIIVNDDISPTTANLTDDPSSREATLKCLDALPGKPAVPDPGFALICIDCIIVEDCRMDIEHGAMGRFYNRLTMFISVRKLLSFIPTAFGGRSHTPPPRKPTVNRYQYRRGPQPPPEPHIVHWKLWLGPSSRAIIPHRTWAHGQPAPRQEGVFHGQRFLTRLDLHKNLQIIDFNPHHLERPFAPSEIDGSIMPIEFCDGHAHSAVITMTSGLPAGLLFKEHVRFNFPYTRVTSLDSVPYDDMALDDERFIGVTHDSSVIVDGQASGGFDIFVM